MITPRLNMHAVLASALLLAACKPSPAPTPVQVWPLSEQTVMTRLAHADVAGLSNALRCSNDIEITPGPLGAHTISWNIARGFNQLGTFTLRLTAISAGNTARRWSNWCAPRWNSARSMRNNCPAAHPAISSAATAPRARSTPAPRPRHNPRCPMPHHRKIRRAHPSRNRHPRLQRPKKSRAAIKAAR